MFEKLKSSIKTLKAQFLTQFWTVFFAAVNKFKLDNRAVGLKQVMMAIVGLSVGLYVAASILPQAIIDITNSTNWTGAPSVVITLATVVVGIVSIVALIMIVLKFAR